MNPTIRKRRKYKMKKPIPFVVLTICIAIFTALSYSYLVYKNTGTPQTLAEQPSAKLIPEPTITIDDKKLHSKNIALVRVSDGKVLYKKDAQTKIYPASMTKIMTAILAIEYLPDINQKIRLPDSLSDLYKQDASMAGFLAGETVSALDLIYGIMLPSGAECTRAISEHISGSESEFTKLMNKKAKELGMRNSNFENPDGLHNPNHYTTVLDMAILTKYALKNETFRTIFSSRKYSTTPSSAHRKGITLYSTMFSSMDTPEFKDGKILGGKTGYTKEAGLCLASFAEKNNDEYILVTSGAVGDHDTEQYHIIDAFTIYSSI